MPKDRRGLEDAGWKPALHQYWNDETNAYEDEETGEWLDPSLGDRSRHVSGISIDRALIVQTGREEGPAEVETEKSDHNDACMRCGAAIKARADCAWVGLGRKGAPSLIRETWCKRCGEHFKEPATPQ